MTALMWFRRDLRLADHPALAAAAQDGPVLPVFVQEAQEEPPGRAARTRLAASLAVLREATRGALVVCSGDPGEVLSELAARTGARSVHVTADLTPQGRRRDAQVEQRLAADGVELVRSGTPYAIAPGTLRTGTGGPYQVFTPFWRAWRERAVPPPVAVPPVRWLAGVTDQADPAGAASPSDRVGEAAALTTWRRFLTDGLSRYAEDRDRPDLAGTSELSSHLAWGEIHPRTLLAELRARLTEAPEGAQRFASELCWREFLADVLWHQPQAAWSDLRGELAGMEHDADGPLVDAWRAGRTGYPFVDAGMRQLLAEGWMHNRVRMTAASFLVKDLHLPWQVGARHFLDHLVDGDLASNNGNWQWVAGTGTDAAPYFRVFNPVRQGLTFDPDGSYVRRWLPELAHVPGRSAHEPWRQADGCAGGYPERIVDHDVERREALARYEQARRSRRSEGFAGGRRN